MLQLTQEVKKKTEDVNELMNKLQSEVRTQPKPKPAENKVSLKSNLNKTNINKIKEAKETQKNSEEVLNKINHMEV